MKRHIVTLVIVHLALAAMAQPVSIRLEAPAHAGQSAVLYRYDDLFTLRLARIADAILDEAGQARISAEVSGTARLRLRIGDVHGDLYARPGSDYRIRVEPPDDRLARTKLQDGIRQLADAAMNLAKEDTSELVGRFGQLGVRKFQLAA